MLKAYRIILSTVIILLVMTTGFASSFVLMPGKSLQEALPELTTAQVLMAETMRRDVQVLATEIGERHHDVPEDYNQAAEFVKSRLGDSGLVPYLQTFGDRDQYQNIIADHYGVENPDEIIIVGAHYDTVWITPGADDNASGVTIMLEMARLLKRKELKRTVRFIAFANEEHPHATTKDMGSMVSARLSSERGENIVAMYSLEMLGYYSNESNSQHYPRVFSWLYPDKGNFVAFVSNYLSRPLLVNSIRSFRKAAVFPSEGLAVPTLLVRHIKRSDHASYWRYGYRGVMVTDTGPYRNYGYHNMTDTAESLNYEAMALIATGLTDMIVQMANQ